MQFINIEFTRAISPFCYFFLFFHADFYPLPFSCKCFETRANFRSKSLKNESFLRAWNNLATSVTRVTCLATIIIRTRCYNERWKKRLLCSSPARRVRTMWSHFVEHRFLAAEIHSLDVTIIVRTCNKKWESHRWNILLAFSSSYLFICFFSFFSFYWQIL